jgi:hypothetical protein
MLRRGWANLMRADSEASPMHCGEGGSSSARLAHTQPAVVQDVGGGGGALPSTSLQQSAGNDAQVNSPKQRQHWCKAMPFRPLRLSRPASLTGTAPDEHPCPALHCTPLTCSISRLKPGSSMQPLSRWWCRDSPSSRVLPQQQVYVLSGYITVRPTTA